MQLALYEAGKADRTGRPSGEGRTSRHSLHQPQLCAACRAHEARYGFRDEHDDDPTVERPRTLAGDATGELEGTGVWTLTEEANGVTVARYDWNVRTTRRWMNLLAPLARPIFKANHDLVMRAGAKGLCTRLGGVSGTCAWLSDGT